MKKVSIIVFSFLFILALYLVKQPKGPLIDYSTHNVTLGAKIYHLSVADTDDKRTRGLSNIASMKDNQGVLFIFKNPGYYGFWMKDMKFSIDVLFVREKKIVDMLSNVSPDTYPQVFIPKEAIDMAIELNASESREQNIKIGDTITF